MTKKVIHVFSDATQDATKPAIYTRSLNGTNTHVSLGTTCSKVAPSAAITKPRMELCAPVAAKNVMLTSKMIDEDVNLFTDTMLRCLNNNDIGFVRYITSRNDLLDQCFPLVLRAYRREAFRLSIAPSGQRHSASVLMVPRAILSFDTRRGPFVPDVFQYYL